MEIEAHRQGKGHKDTAITLRISKPEKNLLAQAAKLRQTTLTNFVLEEAYHAAQETISEQVKFMLNDKEWQLFCDALDRPAMSIEATRKLLTEPSILDV